MHRAMKRKSSAGLVLAMLLPLAGGTAELPPESLSTFNNPWRPDDLNRCH
jgi:hypothetical protein